jgi:hypothetical protein
MPPPGNGGGGVETDAEKKKREREEKRRALEAEWENLVPSESENSEDALAAEHRAEASEDNVFADSMVYWLTVMMSTDDPNGLNHGAHARMPKTLAQNYGVSEELATQIFESARREVDTKLRHVSSHEMLERKASQLLKKYLSAA